MPATSHRSSAVPLDRITEHLVRVRGVSKRYGAIRAVEDVNLDIRAGEVLALVGENGAGKSTLISMLSGAQRPDTGVIEADGRERRGLTPHDARALGIAAIRQEPVLVPTLTVAENLLLGRAPSRFGMVRRGTSADTARQWLSAVGGEIDARRTVAELSPADRQLVEIARAVGGGARVLFFDEPTAALGPAETERLFALIRRLASEGAAIVYVSHRLEEIFALCARIVVMRDGRVVLERPAVELDEMSLVRAMAGRDVEALERAPRRRSSEEPVVRMSGVSVASRLREVDFEVRPGEVHGIAGIVGSGRSALVETLAGIARPTAGEITCEGRRYAPRGPREAIDRGVLLVPEDRLRNALLPDMSQATNVVVSRYAGASRLGALTSRLEAAAARPLLERLDVRPRDAALRGGALSGGNQQKLIVGRALFAGARVLLLDEPTKGVDVGSKADMHRLVRELVAEGLAVVLVSSDLRELMALSDRISVMARGRVVASFDGDVDAEQIIAAATGARTTREERTQQ